MLIPKDSHPIRDEQEQAHVAPAFQSLLRVALCVSGKVPWDSIWIDFYGQSPVTY